LFLIQVPFAKLAAASVPPYFRPTFSRFSEEGRSAGQEVERAVLQADAGGDDAESEGFDALVDGACLTVGFNVNPGRRSFREVALG
jgi:hypothetical protein